MNKEDTNETESREFDTSRLANLTSEEMKELAKQLARNMADVVEVREVTKYHLPTCYICQAPFARGVTLVGGYAVFLCTRHDNLWHEYVDDTGEMASLDSATLRLKIAVANNEEAKALGFSKGVKIAKRALYELGKAWVFDNRTKRLNCLNIPEDTNG